MLLLGIVLGAALGAIAMYFARRPMPARTQATHTPGLTHFEANNAALSERLNLATQTAGIGIWDINLKSGTTHTDATIRDLLGATEETIGKPLRFVHSDDYPSVKATVRQAIETARDEIVPLRCRVVRPDGAQPCRPPPVGIVKPVRAMRPACIR